MSRLVKFLMLVALMLVPSSNLLAYHASLSFSPATGTFNKGCNFSVDVKLDTQSHITDGTDAIIFYDASKLKASQIRNGSIYSSFPGNSIDPQNQKITISGVADPTSPFTGSGTLASVDFTVLDEATAGTTILSFDFTPTDKGKTTDSNVVERGTVSDVLGSVSNATYTIGSGSCNAKPSPTLVASGSGTQRGGPVGRPSSAPSALPSSGDFNSTALLTIVGGMLTVLGIVGLALF